MKEPQTLRKRNNLVALAGAMAALLLLPSGLASGVHESTAAPSAASAVPAPEALTGLSGELLGFGENPLVDVCNTQPIQASDVASLDFWYGMGRDGRWTEAEHNGEDVEVEALERYIFEHQGEDWVDGVFDVLKECAKGGFCLCIAAVATSSGVKVVVCLVCCAAGSMPYCVCDGLYIYASCGCYR